MAEKQEVIVFFPLANDVVSDPVSGIWIEIGPNAKKRISDMVDFYSLVYGSFTKTNHEVCLFAAGTDIRHAKGKTLGTLAYEYFAKEDCFLETIVNSADKNIYGTKPEIIWGVNKVLEKYPPDRFKVAIVLGTQKRHMPRVRTIVSWYCPKTVDYVFFVTGQTKEIPLWREGLSWIKLYLGDGKVAELIQKLRRAFPDKFDQA